MDHMYRPYIWILCPWNSSGKNIGGACYFLLQGNLPNPGSEPVSLVSPALAGGFFITTAIWEVIFKFIGLWSKKIFGC